MTQDDAMSVTDQVEKMGVAHEVEVDDANDDANDEQEEVGDETDEGDNDEGEKETNKAGPITRRKSKHQVKKSDFNSEGLKQIKEFEDSVCSSCQCVITLSFI